MSKYDSDDSSSLNSADLEDISSSSEEIIAPGEKRDISNYGSFHAGNDSEAAKQMAQLLELRHQLGMDSDVAFLKEEKKRSKSLPRGRKDKSCSGGLTAHDKRTEQDLSKSINNKMNDESERFRRERKQKKDKEAEAYRRIQEERAQIAAERENKEKAEADRLRKKEKAKKAARKKEEEERKRKEKEAKRAEKKRREEEEKQRKEEEARKAAKKKQEEEERQRKQEEEAARKAAKKKQEEDERRRKEEEAERAQQSEAERKRKEEEAARREKEQLEMKLRLAEEERIRWKKEMEENAKLSLASAAESKAEEEAAAAVNDDDGGGPYYTIEQLQQKTVPGLDYQNREKYLKPSDYMRLFKVTRDEFNGYPGWKKTRLKRTNGLLS